MEKAVAGFGFAIICLFFFLAVAIRVEMAWGCLVGLAIFLFGSYYDDD